MLYWLSLLLLDSVAGSSGAGIYLTLQTCDTKSQKQRWGQAPLPANLPSVANGTQFIIIGSGISVCPTTGATRCCMNVEAWGTNKGDTVWTTVCAPQEPVNKERNRVWVHRQDGSLYNPASKRCADAAKGVDAAPGAGLVLSPCEGKSVSKWVYSTVDRSLSQATHSGAYPGLCIGLSQSPRPPPAPGPPLPATVNATLTVDTSTSDSSTSPAMVSFNFDWHTNKEEAPVWINMSALILDLDDPMLRAAAKAMSPARLRIGGSEGDVLCYDVPSFHSTCRSMNQSAPGMCLGMERFEALGAFAQDTGLQLVFGLNAVWGRRDHDLHNPLDLTNIAALLRYAAQHKVPLYGVELGNEKCGPPPDVFAKDYQNLQALLREVWPDRATRPLLIGNDCNTNPSYLSKWLPLLNDSVLDVLTYHRYDGYGLDPKLGQEVMTPQFLDKTLSMDIVHVHTKYAPSAQLWVGEAAAAWHSGRNTVTNAYASSFWYMDALAHLAQYNHTGYCRQTLVGGNYGLLNRTNFQPNPDYYTALLYHRLMGDRVLKPAVDFGAEDKAKGWLRVYAQCNRGGTGVTLLVLNVAPNTTFDLSFASPLLPRDEYVFSASSIYDRYVHLNGQLLGTTGSALPQMDPKEGETSSLTVQPHTISYFVLPKMNAAVCQ